MSQFVALVDAVSRLLFVLACVMVGGMVLVVTYDVGTRNLGLAPPIWAVNSVEYGMLHVTFLALPELVRTRGHVCVELLLVALGAGTRRRLEVALHLAAALICLYLAWRSGVEFVAAAESGSYEVRSFDAPMWMLFSTMPIGFLFGALQFLAFLARGTSFFTGPADARGGL